MEQHFVVDKDSSALLPKVHEVVGRRTGQGHQGIIIRIHQPKWQSQYKTPNSAHLN
jgi:hypothetical protein